MLCYKELYGDNSDGNRCVWIVNYEVEESDTDDVVEALYDYFLNGETYGAKVISMCCEGEYVEVEVEIDDYIIELIEKAKADADIKDDIDLQEYIRVTENECIGYSLFVGAEKGYKYKYEDIEVEILPKCEQVAGDIERGYIAMNKNGFVRVPLKKIERVTK